MARKAHIQLFLHGSIFLLVSMLAGFPAFSVHRDDMHHGVQDVWRMYHIILISTGVWTIAVGAALPHLTFSASRERLLALVMIVSGYFLIADIPVYGAAVLLKHLDADQSAPTGSLRMPYYLLLAGNGLTALVVASAIALKSYVLIYGEARPARDF
jgi:hypothetical protein